MSMVSGFILKAYAKLDGFDTKIYIYSKLETGKVALLIFDFKPFFYVKNSDLESTRSLLYSLKDVSNFSYFISDSNFKTFKGEPVFLIEFNNNHSKVEAFKLLDSSFIDTFEADLDPVSQFLIVNNISSSFDVEGNFERAIDIDEIYFNPIIKQSDYFPKNLKILSFDIETSYDLKEIYSISLYSENFKTVLFCSDGEIETPLKNALLFSSPRSMLSEFVKIVRKFDPDIITGWNINDFDFPVLKDFFKRYKIKFNLGRTQDSISVVHHSDFMKTSRVSVPGRVVLDALDLVRTSFIKLDDYKLETAARFILGDSKLLSGSTRYKEIEILHKEDPQKLIDYNLKDSKLVYDILMKENLIDLTIQRSILTFMSLDRVNSSVKTFDGLYLRKVHIDGFVANTLKPLSRIKSVVGGFVLQSTAGIFDNILVLDFKSLYPSIIMTFNIDPFSYLGQNTELGIFDSFGNEFYVSSINGAVYKNTNGYLSQIIGRLWSARDDAKLRSNKLESYAIKIIMNSIYGVLANPNCRFYNFNIANSITTFARFIIKKTIKFIEDLGYSVIYGDTDSVFIDVHSKDRFVAKKLGFEIESKVNKFLTDFVKDKFCRVSKLQIEFEKHYLKFFMPGNRTQTHGAKKRYVGQKLVNDDGDFELDFVGLEFVRRDWTTLSKNFQKHLIDLLFSDTDKISFYIRNYIKDLKLGKFDDLLVYTRALRKDLSSYTKTTPPHVKAARKLSKIESNLIKYVMTVNGPEPISMLKSRIDYDHYVEKQLKPIANTILFALGKNFDDVVKGSSQKTLGDW